LKKIEERSLGLDKSTNTDYLKVIVNTNS
jgi:hypothetical protein